MNRALIIGAAGFVGEYLIRAAIQQEYEVYATKLNNEKLQVENVKIIDLDITDRDQTLEVMKTVSPDVVFHLAAQSSVKLSWDNPQLTANINIIGAINVLEAVKAVSKYIKVLFVGSSEEYGDVNYNCPVREDCIPAPKNIYALTKYAQEQLASIYEKAYGLRVIMTRSFNHIGPKQSHQFVVADFCHQVAMVERGEQQPIIEVGNLSAFRDFTDVRDVVRAYLILVEKGIPGEIYNVGSGKPVKIADILNVILAYSTKRISVRVNKSKFRPIDIPCISANVEKIKALGWKPEYNLNKSIVEILNYERNNK